VHKNITDRKKEQRRNKGMNIEENEKMERK
jgi:hypothetical protein